MPNWDRSTLITDRDLFGALPYTVIVPVTSPAGVDRAMVPDIVLEVILPSASRPPSAVRCFSITSSAVWAKAAFEAISTHTHADNAMSGTILFMDGRVS